MSTTEDRKEANVYELGYLVLPSVDEDKLTDVVSNLKGIIKKAGASELDSETPMKIDLAYTMSKTIGARKYVVNEAYIGWLKFEVEPSNVPEVDKAVRALEEVLRFLLIKTPRETVFTFEGARQKLLEIEAAKKQAQEVQLEPVIQ